MWASDFLVYLTFLPNATEPLVGPLTLPILRDVRTVHLEPPHRFLEFGEVGHVFLNSIAVAVTGAVESLIAGTV